MARIFGLLAMVIAMAIGLYLYAKQSQSIAGAVPGGTLKSAPEITGVKGDLLSIANAERTYMVSEGKYATSIDDTASNRVPQRFALWRPAPAKAAARLKSRSTKPCRSNLPTSFNITRWSLAGSPSTSNVASLEAREFWISK